MRVLIIEDEVLAAERLEKMVRDVVPEVEVLALLDSISNATAWFNENKAPDLAFFDIQLADGLSFEIFEQVDVVCPVIFTTAYDEYALKAFKVNSIDYLLKPIDKDELKAAIAKYRDIHERPDTRISMDNVLRQLTRQFKTRFIVKVGEHIRSLHVDEIQCFYSMEKATYMQTTEDRNYVIDHSIEQVEALVDPDSFFRVNRKFFIARASIRDIISYTNSRLKISLLHPTNEEIIVSREKVKEFKRWLEK